MMRQINVELTTKGLEMEMDRKEFAMALKTWRLRNRFTQEQVATKFGCSRYTIIKAEGAKPITWEMAYRLFARLADELRNEVKS